MTNEQLMILDTLRGAEQLPTLYENELIKKLDTLNSYLSFRLKDYPGLTDEQIENIYVAVKAYME